MRSVFPLLVTLISMLVMGVVSARASSPISNQEAAAKVTSSLLQKVEKVLNDNRGTPPRIALRALSPSKFNTAFEDSLAPALLDQGWEVWILDANQEPQEHTLLFEYKVMQAKLRYPSMHHGFLGLATPKVDRVIDLGLQGRLQGVDDGRVYWQGSSSARYEDSFAMSALSTVQIDQPSWLTAPKVEDSTTSKAGFLEKVVIAGLVGGVVALYISGAQ
jgi:hypothetical protein